jgi:TPP-dependent pyruvate/acetoin dehydrogenase alpha subunit
MQDSTSVGLIEFERRCEEAWKAGKIRVPLHLSGGNERQLRRLFRLVGKEDWVISTHRNHYHYLLKGGNAEELYAEILQSELGVCGGHSGSMHTTDISLRFVSSCLVGCGAPLAVGIAMGIKLRGGKEKVWCFVGDGAVDQWMFWEALSFADGRELPVTFIVEDNDRSVDSSKSERGMGARDGLLRSKRVVRYKFRPTYPHVGNGDRISF